MSKENKLPKSLKHPTIKMIGIHQAICLGGRDIEPEMDVPAMTQSIPAPKLLIRLALLFKGFLPDSYGSKILFFCFLQGFWDWRSASLSSLLFSKQ